MQRVDQNICNRFRVSVLVMRNIIDGRAKMIIHQERKGEFKVSYDMTFAVGMYCLFDIILDQVIHQFTKCKVARGN